MDMDFIIPLHFQELASGQSDGYYVETVYEPNQIDKKLGDAEIDYRNEGPVAILKAFDTFYSVLHHISRLKSEIVERAWEIIATNFCSHIKALPIILDPEGIDNNTRKVQLNTLKMESYVLTHFMEEFESDAAKPGVIVNVGKGKGKSASKKPSEGDFDWTSERVDTLKSINDLMQLEIQRLWNPPIVEEQFTSLFSTACYKMLENQAIVRQTEAKDAIFQILGLLIKRFNHRLGACLKIIQLLQHFEHLVSPLACALEIFINQFGARILAGDIIREIGSKDSAEFSRDTSGTKSFSLFLVEIAIKVPEVVLPNLSLLMVHLDNEAYTMRNGVLSVFGEIIAKVLNKEDLDENMKKTRESLLSTLEDHIHDVTAFVRSKVLQIWMQLFQAKAVPLSRQGGVVDLIMARLRDKSANVRKYAVQFLKIALTENPFGAKLTVNVLKESLEKELAKLAEMEPVEKEEEAPVLLVDTDWANMKKVVRTAIKSFVSDDNIEEDAGSEQLDLYEGEEDALNKVVLQIQRYLKDREFRTALQLLSLAKAKWTGSKEFEVDEMEIDNKMENEEIEGRSSQGSRGSSRNSSQDSESDAITDSPVDEVKKRLMLFYEILLRRIYKKGSDEADDNKGGGDQGGVDIEEAVIQATQQPEQTEENVLLKQQRELVNYLKSCLYFSQQMALAIPCLCQLLGSKTPSDVLEIIDFFIVAHEFGLTQSEAGIRKMANLIWARDPVIKKAVVAAFERLYIDVTCENPRNKPNVIVSSFMSLIVNANLGEMTSLEELVCELMKTELIPQSVINLLWQKFSLKVQGTTVKEQRAALVLLSMIAGAEKDIIKSNLGVLVEHGLGQPDQLYLARDTCSAILKLTEKKGMLGVDIHTEPFRLPCDDELFSRLEHLLIEQLPSVDLVSWSPFCELAVMVIYHLSETPDVVCARLLKQLTKAVLGEKQQLPKELDGDDVFPSANPEPMSEDDPVKRHPKVVARLLFAVGQIALLQLYHLDVTIFSEMKRRNRIQEEEKDKKGQKKAPGSGANRKTPVDESASRTSKQATAGASVDSTMVDDEMGVGGAVAEDAEAEYIRKLCEQDIVTGSNLLSSYTSMIVSICCNRSKYTCPELQAAATLALTKFMLVSSELCDQQIQLLFTILEKSELTHVRSNIIIALGDLTLRFPNVIEPWTPHLYARLRDESIEVRKTTVTILSHLILNDMVKVKGQISEMAVCLEDNNEKIANLAKMFFYELGQKGNALYNIAPDVISRLSDAETGVEEKKFRSIMKYLLQFLQKDKQGESLVEKLCHRFRTTKTDRQYRDLSYCLSVLPYNEKVFKKLQENISCYRTVLCDDDVYANFNNIITNSKKFCKPEFRLMIDEFEKILEGYHTKTIDENVDPEQAVNVLADISSQVNNNKENEGEREKAKPVAGKRNARKKGNVRSTRAKKKNDDDSGSDDENLPKTVLKTGSKRTTKARSGKAAAKAVFSSDDEDDVFK